MRDRPRPGAPTPRRRSGGSPPSPRGLGQVQDALLFPGVVALSALLVAVGLFPLATGAGRAVLAFNDRFLAGNEDRLHISAFPERSTIYAADGSVLARVAQYNRDFVPLGDIDPHLSQAVLAIEDDRFYDHGPVDIPAIVRAAVVNVRAGEVVQGGSTITQQLVKNHYTGGEQTFARKFQEAQDSVRLERTYTKDEILELYLNDVYFGHGAYGVQAAAEYYFAARASDLTLAQSALLAALIKAPVLYDPVANPRGSLARRDLVLDRLLELGWIGGAEHLEAVASPIELSAKRRRVNTYGQYPYFVRYVIDRILDEDDGRYDALGTTDEQRERALFEGGLHVYTTLQPKMQRAAEKAVETRLPDQGANPPKDPQAAVVSVAADTGAIQAMYGGRDYSRQKINLATQSRRTAGSAFKPFALVGAFEQGVPVGKVYRAESPVQIPQEKCPDPSGAWTPSNAEPGRAGYMDLTEATAGSVNVVFAQLVADVGAEHVQEAARRMGVRGPGVRVGKNCSIALGAVEVNPLAMTAGYQTLANGGKHCPPFAIAKIEDRSGRTLVRARPACKEVVDPDMAARVTSMLEGVVSWGTGQAAQLDRPVAGKTGTGQDSRDVWFMGYVPQLVTGVWVGYSRDLIPMRGLRVLGGGTAFGGTLAAPIWHDFMTKAVAELPVEDFPEPPPVETGPVPNVVGLDERNAIDALVEASFTPTVQRVDSAAPEGQVVSQSPGGGTVTELGTVVSIRVSTGVPPEVEVPDVVGLEAAEAIVALESAGFEVEVAERSVRRQGLDGKVLDQRPPGGSSVPPGATVTIVVGKFEKEPDPSPSPP